MTQSYYIPSSINSWTATGQDTIPEGIFLYKLKVTDNANNVGESSNKIKVVKTVPHQTDFVVPVVSSFDVEPHTIKGAEYVELVSASWSVTDSGGSNIDRIELYRSSYDPSNCKDTYKVGCVWKLVKIVPAPLGINSWKSTTEDEISKGVYYYVLYAIDGAGNRSKDGSSVKVTKKDETKPILIITNPINGGLVYVNSSTFISATASDVNGISKVSFYIGSKETCTVTVAPYICPWLVPSKIGTSYTITVKAYDTSNNGISKSIRVKSAQ